MGPLAWESPYAVGVALEKTKKKKRKKEKKEKAQQNILMIRSSNIIKYKYILT